MSAKPRIDALSSRPANVLLAALSDSDYRTVAPLLQRHQLTPTEMVAEALEPARYVYFPLHGLISVCTVMSDATMVEVANVNAVGCTGVPLFAGGGPSHLAFASAVSGDGLRMSSRDFLRCTVDLPAFAALMRRYSGLMLAMMAQSSACHGLHQLRPRMARWILTTDDAVGQVKFAATQEWLAGLLGVARTRVSESAATLQGLGLISYRRGTVAVIDRAGLELVACECYRLSRQQVDEFTRALRDQRSPQAHS